MKNPLITIAMIIVLVFFVAMGTRSYYKNAEKALVEMYDAKIKENKLEIAGLQATNEVFKVQIKQDSSAIAKKNAEISRYRVIIYDQKQQLAEAKDSLKNATATQSIQFMVDYAKIEGSKVSASDVDTLLTIGTQGVKKVDNIFLEHKYQKFEISGLNNIIWTQKSVIDLKDKDIISYKGIVANKELELNLSAQNCATEKTQIQLTSDKYKAQRNKARWAVAGTVGIILAKFILLK